MEFFFFLFVAFIVFSAVSDANKKSKKRASAHRGARASVEQSNQAWIENGGGAQPRAPAQNTQSTYRVKTSRVVNTASTVTRATRKAAVPRKLRFGEKAVVQDKNGASARGFSSARVKLMLDGRRVFGLVALSLLVVYILGQV